MRRGAGGCRRVAGHSYGGAIISDAATGVANVVGLVFASAFAPDEGETLGELNARFAPPPDAAHFQVDVDALGFVWLDPAAFPANFVQDVALQEARVMAAVQEPIAGSLRRAGGAAGVAEVPSWFLVSTGDRMINPDLLRFMADRVGARTVEGSLQQRLGGLPSPTRSPGWSWPPPGSVRGAGQAWLRSWRVAEDWTAAWRHRSA